MVDTKYLGDYNNIKIMGIGFTMLFPLFSVWMFYRWSKISAVTPLLVSLALMLLGFLIAPHITAQAYGSNAGLAEMADGFIFVSGFIYFIVYIIGRVRGDRVDEKTYQAKKSWWKKAWTEAVFGTPWYIPTIFLGIFIATSLAPLNVINSAWGNVVAPLWYFSFILYVFGVWFFYAIWAFIVGKEGVSRVAKYFL